MRNKRADVNSINIRTKDFEPDFIKTALGELISKNVLRVIYRSGAVCSYRFTNDFIKIHFSNESNETKIYFQNETVSEISKEAVTDINNIIEISNDAMTDDNKEAEDEDDFLLKQEMASLNNFQVI